MNKAWLPAVSLIALLASLAAAAGPGTDANGPRPAVILDTMGFWRMHHELAPPEVQANGHLKPAIIEQSWMNRRTAAAPAGWWKADFDDGGWFRGTGLRAVKSPWLRRLCIRGRFAVTDRRKVRGLRLSVDYHGGIVVYVNGRELCRRHLPEGNLGPDALADAYPAEAFADEQGGMLFPGNVRWLNPRGGDFWKDRKLTPETKRRMGLWRRSLADVPIPREMLRDGVNVLAVEIVRSPYDPAVEQARAKMPKRFHQYEYQIFFATCELERIRLSDSPGDGIVSAAVRAPGLQVWNSDPAAPDFDMDFGGPGEDLRPIRLVAPRNGVASGKVVVGDTQPIRGLRAAASELRGSGGAIPASCVQVRYGLPWGAESISEGQRRARYPYPHPATPLACLSEIAPAEIPVWTKDWPRYDPMPVRGAVASVWATVKVPPAASPGTYKGRLTIEVEGAEALRVPLEIKVAEWLAPDPKDYTAWVDLIQSPDTLAVEYGLEPWSQRHWKMIDCSLSLLGEAGNRTLYIPLIAHTNLGNEQSMVRWVRKGPNEYGHDFAVLDRYLDSAMRHMGKPEVVICSVWDLYMMESGKMPEDEKYTRQMGSGIRAIRQERMPQNILKHGGKVGLGPLVTVVDPASGKTENVYLPKLTDKAAKAMWTPLLRQLRDHLARRGLDKALMLGMNCDAWASKPTVQFFDDILPGTPWVVQSHDGFPLKLKLLHGIAKVGYQTRVWGVAFADEDRHDPYRINKAGEANEAGRLHGWNRPERLALFERFSLSVFPATRWRTFAEVNVTGDQRGFGRVGADFWPAVRAKNGRRVGMVHERYPESHWRNLVIRSWVLAPGPAGPCSTYRFEAMREGLLECEARIAIEKALINPASRTKLGEELAARCRRHLGERLKLMWYSLNNFQMHAGGYDSGVQYATGWRYAPGIYGQVWYIGSNWQRRSETLFALAAEVARAFSP